MRVFQEGRNRFNTDKRLTNAEIHDMLEKPGFVGKKITLSRAKFRSMSDFKAHVVDSSRLVDQYIYEFLPQYYYTFEEPQNNGNEPACYYFMEEVFSDGTVPPPAEMDDFLASCCRMFKDTRNKGSAFMVDIKLDNFVYGHTKNNPSSKTYFIDLFPSYFNTNTGIFFLRASELAKVYGYKNLPKTHQIINTL